MKKLQIKEKGITLISLVLTVIIMLILAGVGISVLTNDGGLFDKTKLAADEYNKSSVLEKFRVKMLNLDMQTIYDTGEVAQLADLPKLTDTSNQVYYDKEITYVAVTETEGIVKMDGYTFNVDSNLNVTHINGSLVQEEKGPETPGSSTLPGQKSDITVKLADGMVPVTYNTTDTSWYVATKEEIDNNTWFNYVDTSVSGKESSSQWANIMLRDNLQVEGVTNANTATLEEMYGKKVTSDGSMYVWIPRYAYKIESGYHTDQVGEISVKFLNTNNTYKDGSSTSTLLTNPLVGSVDTTSYRVHPAFTWAKEDGTPVELEGIWVGKFEASGANASYAATEPGNVLTSSTVIVRTIGNVSSWISINRNNIFLNCYNMNSSSNASIYGISTDKDKIDPHLIKNTEWGAAAYLAHSKYGRNKIADESMNNTGGYNTGNGNYKTNVALSTTGNVYGIYDMAGGSWEHTAAYVDSTKGGTVANSYLTGESYGKAVYDAAPKYKDVYRVSDKNDDIVRNYSANADKYGDGIFETSYTSYDGTNYAGSSWNGDHSHFPFSGDPFFSRGGHYSNGAYAGVFAFGNYTGGSRSDSGFRAVLATL